MAELPISNVRPVDEEEANTPNHMIIWLDKHIGEARECVLLKSSFFLAIDPTTGLFERNLNQDDIDRSICLNASLLVRLDEVEFMFQAFVDIEKCYETIHKNRKKRIFFITSASKGKIIIPSLVTLYPDIFPPDNPIYIFCANLLMKSVGGVEAPNVWLQEFIENVLPFDHQDDLLARLTRGIADYFAAEAESLISKQQLDKAGYYLNWSQQMRHRHQALIKKNNA
jgi:hypothetical protein